MSLRPATTVVLLRPSPEGFEVFLVQRNRAVGFMPNAWVFPGGRVDEQDSQVPADRVSGGDRVVVRWGIPEEEARAFLIAAVRETFEESGLWLGGRPPASDARAKLLAGGGFSETIAEATIDLDRLWPWAWWVTPEVEPRRFDTRFLVAIAPEGEAVHDEGETVASRWIRPEEAVALAESSELPMAPPTWWTLRELAACGTLEEVFAESERRPQRPIQPVVKTDEAGWCLILPGHPEHPEPAFPGLPGLVRFAQGRWWAEDGRSVPTL